MGQYVAATTGEQVFVYGKFGPELPGHILAVLLAGKALGGSPSLEPSVAVEILREFGPQEFIGKVYVQKGTTWTPITPESAYSYSWYKNFQEGREAYFDMQGSGRWEIEWFRFESSVRDPNKFLAVALKQTIPETSKVSASAQ